MDGNNNDSDNTLPRSDNDLEDDDIKSEITELKVKLETQEQVNEAIQQLENNYNTIQIIEIDSDRYSHDETAPEESTFQAHFVQFLERLACKAVSEQPALPFLNDIIFNGQIVFGLNEAKFLASILQSKFPFDVVLTFDCRVSPDAFQYLISSCGIKKIDKSRSRKAKPRKQLVICGAGINHRHVKSLKTVLMSSNDNNNNNNNNNIGYLMLHGACISDRGAVALSGMLCQNKSLTVLDLSRNKIGIVGAQTLGEMLCQNSCLEKLDLSANKIGNEGVESIANGLWVNSTLEILSLSSVDCMNDGLLALADSLSENNGLKELDLSYNVFTRDDLEGLQALAQSLRYNNTLTKLNLTKTLASFDWYTGQAFSRYLVDNSTVKVELGLASQGIFSTGPSFSIGDVVEGLVECNSPRLILDSSSCELSSEQIVLYADAIRSGRFNVQSLNLGLASNVNDACIINLFGALVDKNQSSSSSCFITALSLEYVTGVTAVGAQYIVDFIPLTNLQYLYLNDIPIGNDGVQQIATYLNDTKLTRLGLDKVGMQDSGLIALSTVLRNNTKLTHLDIYNNTDITVIGMLSLLETLETFNNTTLTDITCSDIGEDTTNNITHLYMKIKFYEALNIIQRAKIVDPNLVSIAFFPDILEDRHSSIIYWILQSCPHLFL